MKRALCALFFVLAAILAVCLPPPPRKASAAAISSGECLVEVSSRRILFEKDAEKRLAPASTTKILTALILAEDCDPDEEVTVPASAAGTEGSSVYLRAGDKLTVRDLLYGLMLRSGNDCAVTLALHHSGSIEKFARVMNDRAVRLGAENSSFRNPHGLPDDGHYTTARDLALITAAAMENELFRTVVSCKYYAPRGWKNKNKMLTKYEGAIGVKTGYTVRAGRCLVTCAERNGMRLVSAVLCSPEMYERSAELLDGAFSRYSLVKLCDKNKPFEGHRVLSDFTYPLTAEERGKVKITGLSVMPLPSFSGEFAGQMMIYLENDLIFSQNLYIM